MISKAISRKRIHTRIRKKISGTPTHPRLAVFRSNKGIYCQLIDDINGKTLANASSTDISGEGNKIAMAKKVGSLIADKAKSLDITDIKFDRGGFLYHGRVKSLAEGAREGGLNF